MLGGTEFGFVDFLFQEFQPEPGPNFVISSGPTLSANITRWDKMKKDLNPDKMPEFHIFKMLFVFRKEMHRFKLIKRKAAFSESRRRRSAGHVESLTLFSAAKKIKK